MVLILVLVEVVLWAKRSSTLISALQTVLILVLVEVVLWVENADNGADGIVES